MMKERPMMGWPQTGIGTAIEYHCAEPLANNVRAAITYTQYDKETIQQALREIEKKNK